MQDALKPIKDLMELLQLEKQEDFEQFKNFVQGLSLSEKREKGFTWFPVQSIKSGYTIGDRAFVVIEYAKLGKEQSHQFRSGKVVNLFTQQAAAYQPEKRGVINYVNKNKMKIVLNSKDLPDWLNEGQIGVDLMFDERTYLEMEKALKKVLTASNDRLAELRRVILGQQAASSNPIKTITSIPNLNPSQNKALLQISSNNDITIVHGPPGTGKTTTLVQAVKLLAKTEAVILVTAPSNAAVDLLTEKIAAEDLEVIRIGNISRVDENIINHTLEMNMANHPESKNIKKVKIQAAKARKKARKFKRKFGSKEYNERKSLFQEAKDLAAWARQLEDRLVGRILSNAKVITATLVGSSHKVLDQLKFRTVFIDEAAQALEPASWIPILKASRVVLIGDPFQLPPTIKSRKAEKNGLNITMIEKCLHQFTEVSLLNIQYRMNEKIMGFSNQHFYENKLIADQSVKNWTLQIEGQSAISFIDTAGCSFDEKLKPNHQSRYNPDEYNILREHLYQLLDLLNLEELPSIGIISPYRKQVIYMRQAIQNDPRLSTIPLSIDTIDAFQGQEKDVIYISLVRSNTKGEIGFLKDYRRMNVAMTRARKALIVIGDSSTIGQDNFYTTFIDYCEQNDFYKSAWEYMQ